MERVKENEYDYMEDDVIEIDIMKYVRLFLSNWKRILKYVGIFAIVGIFIGFSIPKVYIASSVLAPERARTGTNTNLNSLASLAGINLGSSGTSDAITPDIYPAIVQSTPFVVDLFSTPLEFTYKGEVVSCDYYKYLKEYTRSPWWGYVISAPFRAVGWAVSLLRGDNVGEISDSLSVVDTFKLTREQYAIAKAVGRSVTINVDKKTYIVSLSVSAQNPDVAAVICRHTSDLIQKYVTDYRTAKAQKDLAYYEELYADARDEYCAAQQAYARFVDSNQGIIQMSRRAEQDRLQNEMNLKYNLYNYCAQQVQQAKARVQLDTPAFAVVSPATTPTRAFKPSKMTIMILFMFLGAAVSCISIVYKERKSVKAVSSEEVCG